MNRRAPVDKIRHLALPKTSHFGDLGEGAPLLQNSTNLAHFEHLEALAPIDKIRHSTGASYCTNCTPKKGAPVTENCRNICNLRVGQRAPSTRHDLAEPGTTQHLQDLEQGASFRRIT